MFGDVSCNTAYSMWAVFNEISVVRRRATKRKEKRTVKPITLPLHRQLRNLVTACCFELICPHYCGEKTCLFASLFCFLTILFTSLFFLFTLPLCACLFIQFKIRSHPVVALCFCSLLHVRQQSVPKSMSYNLKAL